MIIDAPFRQYQPELGEIGPTQFLSQSIKLWDNLAIELSGIIGENGFCTLFARSVSLAKARFPWLEKFNFPLQGESQFLHFKDCLVGCDIDEMRDANAVILSAFIETLSSLLGDTLTTYIIQPAWEQRRLTSVTGEGSHAHQDVARVAS
jgi:hypothetical protein